MKVTPAPDHGVRWRASRPDGRSARSCTPQRFIGRSPQVETRLLLFFCLFEWPSNRLSYGKMACLTAIWEGDCARPHVASGHTAQPVPMGPACPSQWRRRLPPGAVRRPPPVRHPCALATSSSRRSEWIRPTSLHMTSAAETRVRRTGLQHTVTLQVNIGFDQPGSQYRQRDSNPCYRRERAAS